MTPATYKLLDTVADSFNPLLALLAIAVPFLRKPRSLRATLAFYLSAGIAIGVVYVVRFIDERQQIWSSFRLDYSTHSAFAASLVVSISTFLRRAWIPLSVSLVLYFCLELFMRYHGVLDILTSASLAAVVALLSHMALVRLSAKSS